MLSSIAEARVGISQAPRSSACTRSLMPAGLLENMTTDQVSDLFAYLKTLKAPAKFKTVLDDPTNTAVTSTGDALGERGLRVVPFQLDAGHALGGVAEHADLAAQLGGGVLPEPLERRVRFRHEPPHRRRHRRTAGVALAGAPPLRNCTP